MNIPFRNDPRCKDWPIWKLPEKEIVAIASRFRFVAANCDIETSVDDDYIRPIATKLGIPGMEAIPVKDNTGWSTTIMTCDGKWSYSIRVSKGFPNPHDNGYEMIRMNTAKLWKFQSILGPKGFRDFVKSMFWFMGFNGEQEINKCRTWDFQSSN